MEDSKLIPEDSNSIELSSEIEKDSTKEENVKAFTEFLEKASNQENKERKSKSDPKIKKQEIKSNFEKLFFYLNFHQVKDLKILK